MLIYGSCMKPVDHKLERKQIGSPLTFFTSTVHSQGEFMISVSYRVTAAILVSQTNPLEVELFSYVNPFFCSNKFA